MRSVAYWIRSSTASSGLPHRRPINLFIWPESNGTVAEDVRTTRGFQLRHWSRGGMSFWAVSDLNDAELAEFDGCSANDSTAATGGLSSDVTYFMISVDPLEHIRRRYGGNASPTRCPFALNQGGVMSTTHRQRHPMSGASWNPSTDRWRRLRRMKMRPIARGR